MVWRMFNSRDTANVLPELEILLTDCMTGLLYIQSENCWLNVQPEMTVTFEIVKPVRASITVLAIFQLL